MTVHARIPAIADRTRPYDLAWIEGGRPVWEVRDLPAVAPLEAAVAMLGRGAAVATPDGPRPVEDLVPGDAVTTPDGTATLDWVGQAEFAPDAPRPALFRVAAHAFGPNRPAAPLLLGGGAQVMVEGAACRAMIGAARAFAPVEAGEDGMAVARLSPAAPITLYGLACAGHESVLVEGLAVATWHPARATGARLSREGLSDLARLCPPIEGAGFGPARVPLLSLTEARDVLLG